MNLADDERSQLIQGYEEQLEELKIIRESAENLLRTEIVQKNEEITSLRMEVASKNMTNFEVRTKNASFDNILKSHMEENKKLRE